MDYELSLDNLLYESARGICEDDSWTGTLTNYEDDNTYEDVWED